MTMYRLAEDNVKKEVAKGELWLDRDVLRMGDFAFELSKIKTLALIQKKVLVLTCEDDYFEIRADKPRCLRKYLAAWNHYRTTVVEGA